MKNLFFWLLILVLVGCSPVRTRYHQGKPLNKQIESEEEQKNEGIVSQKPEKKRFSDTTYIYLDSGTVNNQAKLGKLFNQAIDEFDKEDYNSACEKFKALANTLEQGDSLQYETQFYSIECMILKDEIKAGELKLKSMLDIKDLPKPIVQKVLVRLGQVCCVLKKEDEAKQYFDKLREMFPKSIYLPVANCSAVKHE